MSAFVVSNKHIDALLSYAQRPQYSSPAYYYWDHKPVTFYDNMDEIGQKLVDQNYASVNSRYDEGNVPPIYTYTLYRRPLSPVQAIKACDCWMYQACENPGHEQSEAWEIIQSIRERAIDELPGMEDAKWEITE